MTGACGRGAKGLAPKTPCVDGRNKRLGMFDVLSEEDCRRLYAPRVVNGELIGPDDFDDIAETAARTHGLDLRTV